MGGLGNDIPVVVEVLPREDFIYDSRRVDVCEEVLAHIPSPIAEIQATDEGQVVVNDNEFLMMGPIEGHVAEIFKDIVIRVAQDMDVAMAGCAFWAQAS
jgi:hypothetical protein